MKRLRPKTDFNRNVLTLMTGSTIAQAIPIAITPILTRLYKPEEFGLLALFISITVILGSIANGRYEIAILLPEKNEDAVNTAAIGFLIATLFSIVLLIISLLFNTQITALLGNESIGFWLYFVPFVVWMIGVFNVLNYINIRKKLYKDIATATIYKSFTMAVIQLGFGFIKNGAAGLILGQICSHVVANYRLMKNALVVFEFKKITMFGMKKVLKRYIDFPKYSMWAILANSLSTHLVNILIPVYYSMSTLGLYSLAQRIVGLPSSLIGASIGHVYFEAATKEKQVTGRSIVTFNSTFKKLILIALPVFGVMFIFVEDVFVFVFGEDWRVAGEYAKILLPFFGVRFISATLSPILAVFEKQRAELIINFILIFISISLIVLVDDFLIFLYVFSFFMSLAYVGFVVYYMKLSRGVV